MSQANDEVVPGAPTAVSRQEQLHEEWYGLYGQFSDFIKQKPQKHPMYNDAQDSMQKGESCDFYRGNYESMAKMMNFIAVSKQVAEKQKADNGLDVPWENIFIDMLRLRIGLAMSRALKRWPEEYIPKSTGTID